MPEAPALTFVGGVAASGPSGVPIVVLLLVALLGLPVVVGLVLRWRDGRRPGDVRRDERRMPDPPESLMFGAAWGRGSSVLRDSTRADWRIVAALAAAVLVLLVVTQL
jgi:hypothetical protein